MNDINWWGANCATLGCHSFSGLAGLSRSDGADRRPSCWPKTVRRAASTMWLCLATIILAAGGVLAGWQIWHGGNPVYPEIQIFWPTNTPGDT